MTWQPPTAAPGPDVTRLLDAETRDRVPWAVAYLRRLFEIVAPETRWDPGLRVAPALQVGTDGARSRTLLFLTSDVVAVYEPGMALEGLTLGYPFWWFFEGAFGKGRVDEGSDSTADTLLLGATTQDKKGLVLGFLMDLSLTGRDREFAEDLFERIKSAREARRMDRFILRPSIRWFGSRVRPPWHR